MTDAELDTVYTDLCRTMTELGEARAPLFLARLALLAALRIDDAAAVSGLIAQAAQDLQGEGESEAPATGRD